MDVGETKEKYLYIVNENNANSIHSSNLMLAGILNGRWMVHRGKFLQTHRRSPLWNKNQQTPGRSSAFHTYLRLPSQLGFDFRESEVYDCLKLQAVVHPARSIRLLSQIINSCAQVPTDFKKRGEGRYNSPRQSEITAAKDTGNSHGSWSNHSGFDNLPR